MFVFVSKIHRFREMLDAGCWMLDAGCAEIVSSLFADSTGAGERIPLHASHHAVTSPVSSI
jgi:hypothetical protein